VIEGTVFQADATNAQNMALGLAGRQVDLVLADVPYGWHSQWQVVKGNKESQPTEQKAIRTPIEAMLSALHSMLSPGAVLAVAYDKSQKIQHERYHRLERFQVGKRRILILQNE
jgi:tRNA G10  N-methylase Trm11